MPALTIPATYDEALVAFGIVASDLHKAGWGSAIFIRLLAKPGKDGPKTAGKTPQFPASFRELADRDYRGFKDQGTVRRYWHIADAAIKAGVLEEPELGQEIGIPNVTWHDFCVDYAAVKFVVDMEMPNADPAEKSDLISAVVVPDAPKIDKPKKKMANQDLVKVQKAVETALGNAALNDPDVASYLHKYKSVVHSSVGKGVAAAIKAAAASDTPVTKHVDVATSTAVGWANKVVDTHKKVKAKQSAAAVEHAKQPGWVVLAIARDADKATKLVTGLVKLVTKSIDTPGVKEGLETHDLIDSINKMINALNVAQHLLTGQEIDWDAELSQLNEGPEDPSHPIKEDE